MIDQQCIQMCYKARKHLAWFPIDGQLYIPEKFVNPENRPHYLPIGNVSTVDRLFQDCHKSVCVWILTPDDCRKRIWNNQETAKNMIEAFNSFIYSDCYNGKRPIDIITSIYGLWLGLVMFKENFVWDGKSWRSMNLSV